MRDAYASSLAIAHTMRHRQSLPAAVNNASVAPNLRTCWGRGSLRDSPVRYVEAASAAQQPNASFSQPPYVFAVPMLESCPRWFQLNLLNTAAVQRRVPGALTVLVEGPTPKCAHFSASHGIDHYAVPKERDEIYKQLFSKVEDETLWSRFGKGDKTTAGGLWKLSVIRYFYLGVHDIAFDLEAFLRRRAHPRVSTSLRRPSCRRESP